MPHRFVWGLLLLLVGVVRCTAVCMIRSIVGKLNNCNKLQYEFTIDLYSGDISLHNNSGAAGVFFSVNF